jgi:hypothetical protein
MEDYNAAFLRCAKDVEVLHEQKRRIAAMHFGGVAIECLLKQMLVTSFPEGATMDWYKNERKTPGYGHFIKNPGHDYNEVLSQYDGLQSRVDSTPGIQQLLDDIKDPNGCPFIDMRYSSQEPEESGYNEWREKYQSLLAWLLEQSMKL